MRVVVDLVYPDTINRVELTVALKGSATNKLNQIDKAVEKQFANDPDWARWNLVSMG